jgi:hypothetical protein
MEPKIKKQKILSASRLKTFLSCSWIFYCEYILKLPSATHPKTKIGSLAHLIFEVLQNPRHRKHYDAIMNGPIKSIYNSKAITRLVKKHLDKNPDITYNISTDLDSLTIVGLENDFFCSTAEEVLPPEHEFLLDIDGMKIKGYIDILAFYKDKIKIRDYKSQGKRFTEDEMENNIQAGIYQLYANRKFDKPAEVEFVMLRHPETKRMPNKHLQVVPPYSKEQLEGFVEYLKYLNGLVQNFSLESATSHLKVENDSGFCKRVCQFREPMEYYILLDKEGEIVQTSKVEKDLVAKEGQKVEKKYYTGCPYFYNDEGKQRNFNIN